MLSSKVKKMTAARTPMLYKRGPWTKFVFAIVFTFFALYGLSLVFPVIWMFLTSLKNHVTEFSQEGNAFLLPANWLFSNYLEAFQSLQAERTTFIGMFFNSVWYSVLAVGTNLFVSALTGYVMAKYKFRGRGIIFSVAIFCMIIPLIGTTVALYRLYGQMGLLDTPWFVIVANLGGFGFNFLIMYGFFSNVSWSYAEAVYVDGGGEYTILFKIMLPIAVPMLAALFIMGFIGTWNDYLNVILYLPSYPNLAAGLFMVEEEMLAGRQGGFFNVPVLFAAMLISIVPVLIIFTIFSGIIMKNLTVGGLKG